MIIQHPKLALRLNGYQLLESHLFSEAHVKQMILRFIPLVNLIVPIALSCTHVGISSLCIEGAWMVIGQGSGVAAALAAKSGLAVQDLPYEMLQKRLVAQGQVLELPMQPKPNKK